MSLDIFIIIQNSLSKRPITSDLSLIKGLMIIFTGLAGNIYSRKRMANPGISQCAFNGLQRLRSLTLSNCGIQNMPPLDPTKHNLELLDLVNNDLVFIERNYFSGFHHLKTLDLSGNCLSRIPDITPLTDTLKRFSIRNNLVLSLETFLSAVMYKFLTRLDFSVNKIGTTPPKRTQLISIRQGVIEVLSGGIMALETVFGRLWLQQKQIWSVTNIYYRSVSLDFKGFFIFLHRCHSTRDDVLRFVIL